MRRSFLITCIALVAAATLFTSCKKSFNCTCVYYVNGVSTPAGTFTYNEWRDDAQNLCNYQQSNGFPNIHYPVQCDIK